MKRLFSIWIALSLMLCVFIAPYATAGIVSYTYDDDGRLIKADYVDKAIIYTYDSAGNLLERQVRENKTGDEDEWCLIKNAYGSPMNTNVKVLREFRNRFLLTTPIGSTFVDFYSTCSPYAADFIAKHPSVRAMVRLSLVPSVGISWCAIHFGLVPTLASVFLILALIGAALVGFFRKIYKPGLASCLRMIRRFAGLNCLRGAAFLLFFAGLGLHCLATPTAAGWYSIYSPVGPTNFQIKRVLRRQLQRAVQPNTLDDWDPVYMGGGEFRESWPLLDLQGLLRLDFTLIYGPDLQFKAPANDGRQQFAPWDTIKAFNSSTLIRIVETEDRTVTPVDVYINVMIADDTLVFKDNGAGGFSPVGPLKYQIRKSGTYYYMMDPYGELVYIFRSRALGWDWTTQYIQRAGEVLYVMDRNGNTLSYSYNADNLPTHVSDGLGRWLDLTYINSAQKSGRHLQQVADGYGRTIDFTYQQMTCSGEERDVLVSFTDAMGRTTAFDYYDAGNTECNLIRRINRPEGNSRIDQRWSANPKGISAVDSQKDAYGNETTLDFSQDGERNIMTAAVYPNSTQRSFHHKRERYPLEATDPAGNTFTVSYNDDDQMTLLTDRMGHKTAFSHHGESGKLGSITNARGDTTTLTYSAQQQTFTNPDNAEPFTFTFYNLTRVDYPNTAETFLYDARGNAIQWTDLNGKVWHYTYNARGQLLTAENPTGGVAAYTYNGDGTRATLTDSDTGTTTYAYDAYKRVIEITHADATSIQIAYDLNDRITSIRDENGNVYAYTYDGNGNLTGVTDPGGETTLYAYDLMDRVTETMDRLGSVTEFAYDSMGRASSVTDPNGIQVGFGYDPRGWMNRVTLGGQDWQTGYDKEGLRSSETTPLGNTTTSQRDALGYVSGITNPLGGNTTLTRDSMNRIIGVTDPIDRTTAYDYDNLGFLTGVTLPGDADAQYSRNDLGLISQIADLNGQEWDFGYTAMGRLQTSTDPLGNTWQHTYDVRGRLGQSTFPDAATLTRTYDDTGNLTRALYSGGPDLQYAYDALDRLVTADVVNLTWDQEGRIIDTENPGVHFGAEYDAGGRLAALTYNNEAFRVTYTYDPVTGLLSRVSDDLTGTGVDFEYDNERRLTGITRANGVDTTYTWDKAGRITWIREGSIIDIQYTLDAAGQVTRADMTVPLDPALLLAPETNAFSYDAASQVSTGGYAYDERGRRIASPGRTNAWDGASRLTGINGTVLSYNGLGDLVTRTQGGSTVHYYYNYAVGMGPIVAEKDEGTGDMLRYYVRTPEGRLLYMIDAENGNHIYHYHCDRTGSTLALTDALGAVTDAYAYTPYGQMLQHNGTSTQPFTFVGLWGVRQEGALYHMGARYYDPVSAGFISREPIWPQITDPRQVNPYQYSLNDPVKNIDPTGEETWGWENQFKRKIRGMSQKEISDEIAELASQADELMSEQLMDWVGFWAVVAKNLHGTPEQSLLERAAQIKDFLKKLAAHRKHARKLELLREEEGQKNQLNPYQTGIGETKVKVLGRWYTFTPKAKVYYPKDVRESGILSRRHLSVKTKEILERTARDLGDKGKDNDYGSGRRNALIAVRTAYQR